MQHDKVDTKTDLKPRRRKSARTYDAYIHRIMKKENTGFGLTHNGVSVVNEFITQVEANLSRSAAKLARQNGTRTLGVREIETAVMLLFSEELAVHATAQDAKAVGKIQQK